MTRVRGNHLTTGQVRSCGCLVDEARDARRVDLPRELATGDEVIAETARTDTVRLRCECGHEWDTSRDAAMRLRLRGVPDSSRTRRSCPVCRVRLTVDMRGDLLARLRRRGRGCHDATPNPLRDIDGNGVTDRVVAQAIKAVDVVRLLARQRPVVREPLDAFAFQGRQAPHTAVGIADVGAAPVGPRVPGRARIEAVR